MCRIASGIFAKASKRFESNDIFSLNAPEIKNSRQNAVILLLTVWLLGTTPGRQVLFLWFRPGTLANEIIPSNL